MVTARGLDGIRVVELGQMVAAPWVGKLLADLGADVIKVEPPTGDRARRRGPFRPGEGAQNGTGGEGIGGLFAALNTNKRSVTADVSSEGGRAVLEDLLSEADLFLHDLAPPIASDAGLAADELRSRHRSLVTMSITPFGQTGPYAHWRAEELQVVHGGGWGWLAPGCVNDPDLPPLKPHGHQAAFQSAFAAACAALASVDRAQRCGHGEHIDFSTMAYVAGMLEAAFIGWSYTGQNPSRLGARILNPWRILPTADGHIFLVCVEADQWERLKDLMGRPEWADMEIFDTVEGRYENEDLLHMWLGEWIAGQPVMELFHRGQAQRLAFAPVNTVAQMSEDPHLAAREFLVTYDQPGLGRITVPGAPSRLSNPWWSIRSPAPALGEHAGAAFATSSACAASAAPTRPGGDRPLDGVTVADFTWVWAGPFCTLHLAHLGATVIKIESAARPDLGRRLPTYSIHHDETLDTNGYFNQYGQGKRSITIDMSIAEGPALAKRLALSCDLVVSNYATGVMEGFGLGYEALAAQRPDVIVAAISGYGQHGPYKSYMGYGPTTGPLSGLASLTGYPGGGASELGVSLGDPAAGIATAYALMAALVARRRTGEGQFIDTSMWEAATACIAEGWMETALTGEQPKPMGNWDPLMSPHNVYRCIGDDDWVAVCCADDGEWQALAGEIGLDPADARFATAADRKANEVGLDRIIAAWTSARDQWAVTEQLQAVGVPAYPSLSPRSIEANPHLAARSLIERLDHPAVGQMSHIGIPWLLHDGSNGVRSPAPTLGQHTDEVLTEFLGLSAAEIASLEAAGALR